MNRRQFLSISALPAFFTATGFKAMASSVVALPFHLTKKPELQNLFLSASGKINSSKINDSTIFYYYRPSELNVVKQAFSLGLIQEIWTTPPLLTHMDPRFLFTGALGAQDLHLHEVAKSVRKVLSSDVSLGFFSLPRAQLFFAQTSTVAPESVQCFYPFRQMLFGEVDNNKAAILDCLPLSVIKKRPELNRVELHLDTFSHPVNLGLVIKKDHRRRDMAESISRTGQSQVPKYLQAVYEKFQTNSARVVEDYLRQYEGKIPLVKG